ncbi:hypothetical protein PsorP6_009114 [Peronosclerospora sorghi]|uniref:Uncharacterized protein n=1 Tax=Peronosclerospora sorghi TaxID=230839 RepID=A0ACC0W0E4_9STRA|nr:hypothetical protein PsorP6_009114 [Peronosclerospora sorghi]
MPRPASLYRNQKRLGSKLLRGRWNLIANPEAIVKGVIQIGYYSAGHVLVSAERQRSIGVGRKYGFQSTVGVLAQLVGNEEDRVEMLSGSMSQSTCAPFSSSGGNAESSFGVACVRFTVDGIALRDSNNSVMKFTLPIPSRSDLYPTLTMHSHDVHMYSRMSAPDIGEVDLQDLDLSVDDPVEIWCLYGLRLGVAV